MINPTGVAFALYPVTDVSRARQFYGQTLGLKAGTEMEFEPGKWWIEYDIGGPSGLIVTNYTSPATNSTPTPGVAIEISNYDDFLAAMRAAGIAISFGPHDSPVCRSFGFKDPDGNDLYFHQRKSTA